MKILINEFKDFLVSVANDPRIPVRDKRIILVMLALVISPIDFIPDWTPVFGLVDDVIMLALIFDYFFEVLDQSILLSHYPWSMKSFARIKRMSQLLAFFAPTFVKNQLWKYEREPF